MSLLDFLRRKRSRIENDFLAEDESAAQDPDAFFGEVAVDFAAIDNPRAEKFPNAGPFPWLDRPDAESRIAARQKAGVISKAEAEQLRFWVANGYVILKGAVEPGVLDEAWAAYEAAIHDGTAQPPSEPAGRK